MSVRLGYSPSPNTPQLPAFVAEVATSAESAAAGSFIDDGSLRNHSASGVGEQRDFLSTCYLLTVESQYYGDGLLIVRLSTDLYSHHDHRGIL